MPVTPHTQPEHGATEQNGIIQRSLWNILNHPGLSAYSKFIADSRNLVFMQVRPSPAFCHYAVILALRTRPQEIRPSSPFQKSFPPVDLHERERIARLRFDVNADNFSVRKSIIQPHRCPASPAE